MKKFLIITFLLLSLNGCLYLGPPGPTSLDWHHEFKDEDWTGKISPKEVEAIYVEKNTENLTTKVTMVTIYNREIFEFSNISKEARIINSKSRVCAFYVNKVYKVIGKYKEGKEYYPVVKEVSEKTIFSFKTESTEVKDCYDELEKFKITSTKKKIYLVKN